MKNTQSFTKAVKDLHELSEKFASSNLERAIREAVATGDLFVMPANRAFAYVRGSGPISFHEITLGPRDESVKDTYSSLLIAKYRIYLASDEDEDEEIIHYVYIPERFLNYVEKSRGIAHAPQLTRIEFDYKVSDFRAWVREKRAKKYEMERKNVEDKIAVLNKRLAELKSCKAPKRQSAFG